MKITKDRTVSDYNSELKLKAADYEKNDTILFFGNPYVPYSWETISRSYAGYTCLFSEDFINFRTVLKASDYSLLCR